MNSALRSLYVHMSCFLHVNVCECTNVTLFCLRIFVAFLKQESVELISTARRPKELKIPLHNSAAEIQIRKRRRVAPSAQITRGETPPSLSNKWTRLRSSYQRVLIIMYGPMCV